MDRSTILDVLKELNLNEDSVANIYNYGSWVYGTNSPTSDRDLMIITRSPKPSLSFTDEFEYFHDFELHKLWNQYDVCVHSVQNFEKLLEKNYILAIECIFLPDEFKIKEQIDFRPIYLAKYYNILRLKQVALYENSTAINMFNTDDNSIRPLRSSRSDEDKQSKKHYLLKNLFHGFRYLDFVEQLIQTKSIHNFKRVSHVFNEIKEISGDTTDDTCIEPVLNFIRDKSAEYKSKLDVLVPPGTTIIKGTFEVHITFDCTNNFESVIEKLQKLCKNTKYKILFIALHTRHEKDEHQQLMVSAQYHGEYPSIVKQIENEAYQYFKNFNIIRIKIKSSLSNTGIPQTDIEKQTFWYTTKNYFEFRYKMLLKSNDKRNSSNLHETCNLCMHSPWFLSHKAFLKKPKRDLQYMITIRLFDVGRKNALKNSNQTTKYLAHHNWPSMKTISDFIVYDTNIELDNDFNLHHSS